MLGIRWREAPAFVVFSLAVRPLEMIGMYWTLVHRRSIEGFVARNFA